MYHSTDLIPSSMQLLGFHPLPSPEKYAKKDRCSKAAHPYFDYEAYGRDVRINEDGHFAPGGYVLNNGGKFIEHYHGIVDIPAEHKVFAFPQLTVREQMAAYKEIIDGSSLEGYRKIAKKEHEER